VKATIALPFQEGIEKCTIYLDITRQDLAELKRTHIPAVLRLAELVIEEAENDDT
jgi:hypothetical protein